jgi:uncharacterized protein (TIGR03437 family)
MKFALTSRRTIVRPIIFLALLLALAGVGSSRRGFDFWRQTASAQTNVTVVNAASFVNDGNKALTPDTIAAAFGTFVTQNNQVYAASSQPLPVTLGGVSATINNVPVGLFFVSPLQINLQIPSNIVDGTATIVVTNSDNTSRSGTFTIVRAAPGLFSAKANGQGVAAAQTTTDGLTYLPVFNQDGTERDVSAGTSAQPNILVLYGTGIRYTPAQNPTDPNGVAESVTVKLQGVTASVQYAGPAPNFVGLDQINVVIPPEMSGLGSVNVVLSTNNRSSNAVTIKLGGSLSPIRPSAIAIGETKTASLVATDQVQKGSNNNLYFFDAYDFTTTTPNTAIALDMRSTEFNAGLLLYKVNQDNTLPDVPAGFDDDFGGMGNGDFVNDNSLLLYLLKDPGRYVVLATSSDLQPVGLGAYTLKLSSITATQLNYGQTVNDASITNTDLQTSAGDYLDVYWFNGAINDNVQTTMTTSAGYFPAVFMQSNDGEFFAFDVNESLRNTAQVTARLNQNSIHLIIATPFEPNRTGAYTFSLNKLSSFGPATGAELEQSAGRMSRGDKDATRRILDRSRRSRIIE